MPQARRFPRNPGQTRKGGCYDRAHQAARAAAAKHHHPTDPCARCGHPLGPMSKHLHYDHAETGGYLGFSHGTKRCPICGKHCNLHAGASKGGQVAKARRLAGTTNAKPRTTTPTRWAL